MPVMPPKVSYWIEIIGKFISVQILVQILSLASSIFLVRILSREEYGFYTIATNFQGTIPLLADMGIGTAISAIGGGIYQDKYRFGRLIATAIRVRFFLSSISFAVFTPILIWMLLKNGASITNVIALTSCVVIGAIFQITIGIFINVPRLSLQIDRVQNLDLIFAVSRTILLGVNYLTFINAAVATGSASLAYGLQRLILGKWVDDTIDLKAGIDREYFTKIVQIIKQSAPNAIYFCFQGQITLALISLFGNVNNIAAIGALGRIGVIFSIMNSVVIGIVVPNFSRCQSRDRLVYLYWQIIGVACLFSITLFSITLVFPSQILWILGSQYAHLEVELNYMMFSSLLFFIVNTMWSINSAKAWISKIWLQIPGTLICQMVSILTLDLSTLKGAIIFGMSPLIPGFILNSYMTYQGLKMEQQKL